MGHKELNTTIVYARAHDQTMADDYFAAMSRVEQRLEIVPEPPKEMEPEGEVVDVLPTAQLMVWVERLALPELCQQERLEIAECLKQALSLECKADDWRITPLSFHQIDSISLLCPRANHPIHY